MDRSSELKPSSTHLVATAVEQIDDMIAKGRLAPGQRLIETDLANQLGIRRGVLREAMRILAGDGVLELIPNKGARVRDIDRQQLAERLKAATALVFLDVEGYIDYARSSPTGLNAVDSAIKSRIKKGDAHLLLEAMTAFTREIAKHSGGPYIREVLSHIRLSHYHRLILDTVTPAELAATASFFPKIAQAIRDQDIDEAHRMVRAALRHGANSINGPSPAPSVQTNAVARVTRTRRSGEKKVSRPPTENPVSTDVPAARISGRR